MGETVSSPTVLCVRSVLSHSTRYAAPPWMGTVRSIMSFNSSNGSLSISLRSMSSIIFASGSSSGRTAVTFGAGSELFTWLSIISEQMLRTCGVSLFSALAVPTSGIMRRLP